MKIRDRFKRYAKVSLPTLVLGFSMAAGIFTASRTAQASAPPQAAQTETVKEKPVQPDTTYWKHPEYDAVLQVWEDPEQGLRGKLVSLGKDDVKVREIIGKILEKQTKDVTDADVQGFVGMEGDLTVRKLGEDHWKGSMYWPYKHKSYGVEIKPEGERLSVRGFFLRFPIIGRTVELQKTERPKTPEEKPIEIASLPKPPAP